MNQRRARRGVIELPHRVDVSLRIGARSLLAVAIAVFLIALLRGNLPRDPEGGALTDDLLVTLQMTPLVCIAIGLLTARDSHALTVLVSPTAWIGGAEHGADHWGGYAAERRQISEFLAEQAIENIVLVGGDAHMVAIDDGTNSGYAGGSGFPVLQVAALDRPGSTKGRPYSEGVFPGRGHFGVVEVTDTGGDSIDVELIGLDWKGDVLTSLRTTFSVP